MNNDSMNHDETQIVKIPLKKTSKGRVAKFTIVDSCDADLAKSHWRLNGGSRSYAIAYSGSKRVLLHRVILERKLGRPLETGEIVDHISGDVLDNRRENLRLATHTENMRNRKIAKHNKSGYKGVRFISKKKLWRAEITINGKKKHLGYFDTPEHAHQAYCAKAQELHGEFANDGTKSLLAAEPIAAPSRTIRMTVRSKTGVVGVSYAKRDRAYVATITYKGISYYLGFYKTFATAVEVRKLAEERIANDLHPITGQPLLGKGR